MPVADDALALDEHNPDGELPEAQATFAADSAANLNYFVKRFAVVRGQSDVTRSDFWICLVFASVEQKNEFLEKTKLGDKDEQYLNGVEVARKLGVILAPVELPKPKRDASYDALAMET